MKICYNGKDRYKERGSRCYNILHTTLNHNESTTFAGQQMRVGDVRKECLLSSGLQETSPSHTHTHTQHIHTVLVQWVSHRVQQQWWCMRQWVMWWGPALLVHTQLRMWLMQSLTHPPPHPTLPMDTSHKTRSESEIIMVVEKLCYHVVIVESQCV